MNRKVPIASVMTPLPHTIGSKLSLDKAFEMMKEFQVRHLPVQEKGFVVGMISERDIRIAETFGDLKTIQVQDVMTQDPYAVAIDQSLIEVCLEMVKHKYGSAIVLSQSGSAIGIFTAVDALRTLAEVLN